MSEGFSVQLGRDNPFGKFPQLTKKSCIESSWINPYSGVAEDLVAFRLTRLRLPMHVQRDLLNVERPGNRHIET